MLSATCVIAWRRSADRRPGPVDRSEAASGDQLSPAELVFLTPFQPPKWRLKHASLIGTESSIWHPKLTRQICSFVVLQHAHSANPVPIYDPAARRITSNFARDTLRRPHHMEVEFTPCSQSRQVFQGPMPSTSM